MPTQPDFVALVAALVNELAPPYAVMQLDALAPESESTMIRRDPSQATETRYMDGGRAGVCIFSVYAKSMDQDTALDWLALVGSVLDLPSGTDVADGIKIGIEMETAPVFVSVADNGEWIYSSGFSLDYVIGA